MTNRVNAMIKTARNRGMTAQAQRLVCEQERTRQALLKEVRRISTWGARGVGRKLPNEVLEEAIARITKAEIPKPA